MSNAINPIKPITKDEMDDRQKELLSWCGADAQNHPLIIDSHERVCFKADPVIRKCVDRLINLNDLWAEMSQALNASHEARLSMRSFYRNMGYSLGGYIEIFGEQLEEEEKQSKGPN
jgi:hypothetical protein